MTQRRPQLRGMCRACGYTGTKASMTRHQQDCPQRQRPGVASQDGYRLRITGAEQPAYWLDVEVPVRATLDDLDGFLRGIWLECCGHLSQFSIGPQDDHDDFSPFSPARRINQPPLERLLTAGDRFGYTYDFGSSTDLDVVVQARESVTASGKPPVRLLARNLPPALTCRECGAPARWVHSWEYEGSGEPLLYCDRHGKKTRDEQLPVVNSPRMGVCGYEGGNDDDWPPATPAEGAVQGGAVTGKAAAKGKASPPEKKPAGKAAPRKAAPPRLRLEPETDVATFNAFMKQIAALNGGGDDLPLDELRALPLDPDAVWIVAIRAVPGVVPPQEGLPSVVLVLDAVSGLVLTGEVISDATPQDVQDVVLDIMLDGPDDMDSADDTPPTRPGRILTTDAALAALLSGTLAGLDVQVQQQDIPDLDDVLDQMTAEVTGDLKVQQAAHAPRAFLTGVRDEEVQALQRASARFMAARPWQVFAPDRVLRASWTQPDGAPGQLYALVMGDLGETHGLALYPDWLTYVKHVNNSFNPRLSLLATGGLESLSMSTEAEFDPQDWARLRAAGLGARAKTGPALLHFSVNGTAPPRSPLRPVIALLNAVSGRAERRSNEVTSLKAEIDGVRIQFPAGPRDDLSAAEQTGSVRVVVHNSGQYVSNEAIILTGPPDMLVSRALSTARRWLQGREKAGVRYHLPYRLESPDVLLEDGGLFGDLHARLWEGGVGAPNLTLAHLLRLGPTLDTPFATVQASAQPGEVADLTVELGPAAPPATEQPNLWQN